MTSRKGFVWSTTSRADPGNVSPEASDYENVVDVGLLADGPFTEVVSDLDSNSVYYYRAFGHDESENVSIPVVEVDSFETDFDGWSQYGDSVTRSTDWSSDGDYSVFVSQQSSLIKEIDFTNIDSVILDLNATQDAHFTSVQIGTEVIWFFMTGVVYGHSPPPGVSTLTIDTKSLTGNYLLGILADSGFPSGNGNIYVDNIRFIYNDGLVIKNYHYGDEVSFQTPPIAEITTEPVTNIDVYTATFNGNVTELNSPNVVGSFLYSVTGSGVWEETDVEQINETGVFSQNVAGLIPETEYTVQFLVTYQMQEQGSDPVQFSTLNAIDGNQYVKEGYRLSSGRFFENSHITSNSQIVDAKSIAFFMKDNSVDCGFLEVIKKDVDSFETDFDGWSNLDYSNISLSSNWSTDGTNSLRINGTSEAAYSSDSVTVSIYKIVDFTGLDSITFDANIIDGATPKFSYKEGLDYSNPSGYTDVPISSGISTNNTINTSSLNGIYSLKISANTVFAQFFYSLNMYIDNIRYKYNKQITINQLNEFEQIGFTNFVETSETVNTWKFVTLEFDEAEIQNLTLGKTGTDFFTGKIDEFMIFDKHLSEAEKTIIKNKFFWNNTSLYENCLLWWSFDSPIYHDDRGSWEQIFLEEYE